MNQKVTMPDGCVMETTFTPEVQDMLDKYQEMQKQLVDYAVRDIPEVDHPYYTRKRWEAYRQAMSSPDYMTICHRIAKIHMMFGKITITILENKDGQTEGEQADETDGGGGPALPDRLQLLS